MTEADSFVLGRRSRAGEDVTWRYDQCVLSNARTPMGTAAMGMAIVRAKIENLKDVDMASHDELAGGRIRTLAVDDAMVDTTTTVLMIPAIPASEDGEIDRQRPRRTTWGR